MESISHPELLGLLVLAITVAHGLVKVIEKMVDLASEKLNGKSNGRSANAHNSETKEIGNNLRDLRSDLEKRSDGHLSHQLHMVDELKALSENSKHMSDNLLVMATKMDQWFTGKRGVP